MSGDIGSSYSSSEYNYSTAHLPVTYPNGFDAGVGVVGCVNLGNTCALNSVLQALASLGNFAKYLRRRQVLWSLRETDLRPCRRQEVTPSFFGGFTPKIQQPKRTRFSEALLLCLNGLTYHYDKALGDPRDRRPLDESPRLLYTQLMSRAGKAFKMERGQQEDAQEILQLILDMLRHEEDEDQEEGLRVRNFANCSFKDLVKTGLDEMTDDPCKLDTIERNANSGLHGDLGRNKNPLLGWQASELTCCTCGWTKPMEMVPFLCLHLPLPVNGRSCHLSECMSLACGPEKVGDLECLRCTLAREIETEERRLMMLGSLRRQIATLGKLDSVKGETESSTRLLTRLKAASLMGWGGGLTLTQIERERKPTLRTFRKKMVLTRLPRVLCLHLCRRISPRAKLSQHVKFPFSMSASELFLINWMESSVSKRQRPPTYEIASVIVHHGAVQGGGHFTSFRRTTSSCTEGWVHVSDVSVRPTTVAEVETCEAYLLFYELKGL